MQKGVDSFDFPLPLSGEKIASPTRRAFLRAFLQIHYLVNSYLKSCSTTFFLHISYPPLPAPFGQVVDRVFRRHSDVPFTLLV